MRVMAIVAHPDDEVGCSGTLLACKARGDDIVIAVATDGRMGHKEILPPELCEVRRGEMARSAQVCGAELIWVGIRDELVFDNEPTRMLIADIIRQGRPDVLITHSPEDYHPDHRSVSKVVFDASFMATLKNVVTAYPCHSKVPPLFHMETVAGLGFIPTDYVDITARMANKRAMMMCHESQVKWLMDHDHIDILEVMETVARFRGLQANVRFAESYRRVNVWPRATAERLLP